MLYWWFAGQDVLAAAFFLYFRNGSVWTVGLIVEMKEKISPT